MVDAIEPFIHAVFEAVYPLVRRVCRQEFRMFCAAGQQNVAETATLVSQEIELSACSAISAVKRLLKRRSLPDARRTSSRYLCAGCSRARPS